MLAELLQKKNEEIGKLRQEILSMKSTVKEVTIKYDE